MPIRASQLNALLEESLNDKTVEPLFFRALLESTLYPLAPISDDSPRLRFIQFTRPDGLTVLPFFSDIDQAVAASGNAARVVPLLGRIFLEVTRGAILMLNPNGIHCTLYPEEIAVLLDSGEVATVEKVETPKGPFDIRVPEPRPGWLLDPLVKLYAQLDCIEAAYLVEKRLSEDLDQVALLIVLAAPKPNSERAVRATVTLVQPLCCEQSTALDIMTFDPAVGRPDWITKVGVEPFYQRALVRQPLV